MLKSDFKLIRWFVGFLLLLLIAVALYNKFTISGMYDQMKFIKAQ